MKKMILIIAVGLMFTGCLSEKEMNSLHSRIEKAKDATIKSGAYRKSNGYDIDKYNKDLDRSIEEGLPTPDIMTYKKITRSVPPKPIRANYTTSIDWRDARLKWDKKYGDGGTVRYKKDNGVLNKTYLRALNAIYLKLQEKIPLTRNEKSNAVKWLRIYNGKTKSGHEFERATKKRKEEIDEFFDEI